MQVPDELKRAPEHNDSISSHIAERANITLRILVIIFFDAMLFVVWILLAWVAHIAAHLAKEQGVEEAFANLFMWVSSSAVFLLLVCHISIDVIAAFRRVADFAASRPITLAPPVEDIP